MDSTQIDLTDPEAIMAAVKEHGDGHVAIIICNDLYSQLLKMQRRLRWLERITVLMGVGFIVCILFLAKL